MQKKDLAYSLEEVRNFLKEINYVHKEDEYNYSYKNAQIRLEKNEEHSAILNSLPRCYMFLTGNECDINEFYKYFMINHMTMGG